MCIIFKELSEDIKKTIMTKEERISNAIKGVVSKLMESVMKRVLITDPFIKEKSFEKTTLCSFSSKRNI